MRTRTGERFGRLVVLEFHHAKGTHYYWKCRCDCGNYKIVRIDNLTSGTVKSCGCLNRERCKEIGDKGHKQKKGVDNPNFKHGLSGTRLYTIWVCMKQRCGNTKATEYSVYGGRGITVCEEWKTDFNSFAYWAITHGYTDKLTIDRINVNGNYEPSNCRWIPQSEQYQNMQRSTQ